MGKWILRLVLVLMLATAAWFGWNTFRQQDELELHRAALIQGPLSLTVTATGRLAPTTSVPVGCEVSGIFEEVLVSHNDRVTRGQVIARIKPEMYRAEHEKAKADLARATAQLRRLEVQLRESKRQFDRVEQLRKEKATTDDEYNLQLASWDTAKAEVEAGQSAIQGAQSNVELTKYRLDRTVITSPIDGIVLDRQVDTGQTVAAALQAPKLFVLAEDLKRMELFADVSEADVGYICPGQNAKFTVNAYRDRTYTGQVRQVRNQPVTTGNVVTYTVVIEVVNDYLLLRPGMPTDVSIEIVRREAATKIANGALRFRPPIPPDDVRQLLAALTWPPAPGPITVTAGNAVTSRPGEAVIPPPTLAPSKATLWQYQDGRWVPVPVWATFTDNRETAVVTGPGVGEQASFVVEARKPSTSQNSLQRAIMMSRPENRRL